MPANSHEAEHEAELNARPHAATGKTAGVDPRKNENEDQLTRDEPSEMAFEIFRGSREAARKLCIDIFQKHFVKKPAEKENEDECYDEGDGEFFPVHNF